MKVLNIHGYKGTPFNAAYSALCGIGGSIVSPEIDYDSEQPDELLKKLLGLCEDEEADLIVGTSLGGFFASLVSITYQKPLLLVNPCFCPQEVIPALGYEGDTAWFKQSSAAFYDLDRERVRCIIGGRDEIIGDHSATKKLLGEERIVIIPDGMHAGATLALDEHFPEMLKSLVL